MGGLQPWHIALFAIIILLVFGSKKLPDATRSVGRSLRIFKSEIKGLHDDEDDEKGAGVAEPTADATATQPQIPAPHVSPAPSASAASDGHQDEAGKPTEVGGQRR
jgi:sec-independent protein translocase protein TatA